MQQLNGVVSGVGKYKNKTHCHCWMLPNYIYKQTVNTMNGIKKYLRGFAPGLGRGLVPVIGSAIVV